MNPIHPDTQREAEEVSEKIIDDIWPNKRDTPFYQTIKNSLVAHVAHALQKAKEESADAVVRAVEEVPEYLIGDHSDCEAVDIAKHNCDFNEGRDLGRLDAIFAARKEAERVRGK